MEVFSSQRKHTYRFLRSVDEFSIKGFETAYQYRHQVTSVI